MKLTRDAQIVTEVVTMLGGHALLVGGCVRDQVLGIESKDIDIEVHGPVTPEALIRHLEIRGRVDTVGQSFGVIKFGQDVDVSFPRRDSKAGSGHTGFTVEFDQSMTVEEALSRRDFTINSMALDAVTGELHDPFKGQLDLLSHTIRHTSDETFADDPLRVLRGVQFASRFGFVFATKTAQLAREMVGRFSELSVERVWVEWEKILTKGQSMQAVTEALIDTGWIEHFPEWGASARVTDRIVRRSGVEGDARAVLILGTQFAGRERALRTFLRRIDAPLWLRRDASAVAQRHQFKTLDPAIEARLVSRAIGPGNFALWLQAHQLTDRPIARQETALPALLRGDDLIRLGMKPGPEFGAILKQAETIQDMDGWTTKEEALEWLSKR
jgi:tRNA nucleotidyltransferase/poly(A) polymerase